MRFFQILVREKIKIDRTYLINFLNSILAEKVVNIKIYGIRRGCFHNTHCLIVSRKLYLKVRGYNIQDPWRDLKALPGMEKMEKSPTRRGAIDLLFLLAFLLIFRQLILVFLQQQILLCLVCLLENSLESLTLGPASLSGWRIFVKIINSF